MQTASVRIGDEAYQEIKEYAKLNNITASDIFRNGALQYITRENGAKDAVIQTLAQATEVNVRVANVEAQMATLATSLTHLSSSIEKATDKLERLDIKLDTLTERMTALETTARIYGVGGGFVVGAVVFLFIKWVFGG